MRRILLKVAYDGTHYHGFAYQEGQSTISGELKYAIRSLWGEDIEVEGASRTDAGVHSHGNLITFDTDMRIPPEKISFALNTRLPEDIRVWASREVSADFSLRNIKTEKTYVYRIYSGPFPDPVRRLYSHYTAFRLDTAKMQEGADFLIGKNDFKSFSSVYTQAKTTVREITYLTVKETKTAAFPSFFSFPDTSKKIQNEKEAAQRGFTDSSQMEFREIEITVKGYGFLYNMVRIIAGTLIEVGRGRYEPQKVKEILLKRDRSAAGPTAPARGLTLESIHILTPL